MICFHGDHPNRTPLKVLGYSALGFVASTMILTALIFILFPKIDMAVAHFFYQGEGLFFLTDTGVYRFVDDWIRPLWFWLIVIFIVLVGLNLVVRHRLLNLSQRSMAYVGLVYIMGPGLLVNGFLKSLIGRVRPRNLLEFGGQTAYSGNTPLSLVNAYRIVPLFLETFPLS